MANKTDLELTAKVPIWLKALNFFSLLPILLWPFLFLHVDAMLESSMKFKWPIFILMLIYPLILIGNIFLTRKLYKCEYRSVAIQISILLALIFGYLFVKFFF